MYKYTYVRLQSIQVNTIQMLWNINVWVCLCVQCNGNCKGIWISLWTAKYHNNKKKKKLKHKFDFWFETIIIAVTVKRTTKNKKKTEKGEKKSVNTHVCMNVCNCDDVFVFAFLQATGFNCQGLDEDCKEIGVWQKGKGREREW